MKERALGFRTKSIREGKRKKKERETDNRKGREKTKRI